MWEIGKTLANTIENSIFIASVALVFAAYFWSRRPPRG